MANFSPLRRFALLALLCSPGALGQAQKPGLQVPQDFAGNANTVKEMFSSAYSVYRKFAFGHDDLEPVSKSFNDGRNGWGATIIDAMSTMSIMGLDEFFMEAVNFSSNIDFSISKVQGQTVSVFETTIRYLGGLLSAFELSGRNHPVLVQKAKEVADKMAFAWVGDNNIPFGFLDFSTDTPTRQGTNIAEAGTLSLEWFTLTQHTGNDTYRNLTERSVRQIISQPDPLPALAPQCIDPTSGQFTCGYITWGGGSDSYFEYLLKYAWLSGTQDNIFIDTWREAVDSSIKTLLKTSTVGDHVYLADFDNQRQIRHISSHLACFHGGNWLLGGKLLNNQTIIDVALQLIDGCWNTYASTATGIGPEGFAFISADGNFTGGNAPSASDLDFNSRHGFYITSSAYILRPEVLESNFYGWRITGDVKYLERAASAIESFNRVLAINGAFSGITNVNSATGGARFDDMESFFFAEVMKYLFLTFDDPEHISIDNFIFNTEAHPFIAGPVPSTFNTNGRPFIPTTTRPFQPNGNIPRPAVSPNPFLSGQVS